MSGFIQLVIHDVSEAPQGTMVHSLILLGLSWDLCRMKRALVEQWPTFFGDIQAGNSWVEKHDLWVGCCHQDFDNSPDVSLVMSRDQS